MLKNKKAGVMSVYFMTPALRSKFYICIFIPEIHFYTRAAFSSRIGLLNTWNLLIASFF